MWRAAGETSRPSLVGAKPIVHDGDDAEEEEEEEEEDDDNVRQH